MADSLQFFDEKSRSDRFRVNGYIRVIHRRPLLSLSFGDPGYQPIANDYNVATIGRLRAILDCLPFAR